MSALWAVARKELIHIRRDPRLVGYVLAIPVLLVLLFGSALRLKVDNLTLAVNDQDRTFFSLQVKDHLRNEGRLKVVEVDSDAAVYDLLSHGKAHVGLIVPKGFSKNVADHETTTFPLLVDGTMPTLAQAALCGAGVLTDEDTARALALDDPENPSPPCVNPIKIEDKVLFNPELRDSDFFLPGTIGIVIMLVSLALSTGLVREKEEQTIEQLWATPISRFALIGGKMIPYAVVATTDFLVCALLARVIFSLPFRGSVPATVLLGTLFVLALLSLGSVISAVSKTQLQVHFINVFVFIVSILMSGFIFPVEAMPPLLQPVAWALPMTYFVHGIRALTLKGISFADVAHDFVALCAFIAILGALSVRLLRKQAA